MKKFLLYALFMALPLFGAAKDIAPYCGPLTFTTVEPITLVKFSNINNATTNVIGGTAHEDFTAITGNVSQGNKYTITLKGNTAGFTNRFVVFIDWNKNGNFSDAGETIEITQTISNSTGLDAIEAVQDILIPATATLGNTRMRVKKIFGTTNFLDPCLGTSFGSAEDYTLNIVANPFLPYCGPLLFPAVEPITLVNFAGINNVTSPTIAGGTAHENFTAIKGSVNRGDTYKITLKGNTDGTFTDRFVVFIDWNKNGNFDDAGETIEITQTINGSTGVDAIQAVQDIVVPLTASLGDTRMRVKKIFGTSNFLNPCLGSGFGQAEDYTLTVKVVNPFSPYCGPLNFTNVEPITLVKFAGINNVTSATTGGAPHENFIPITGTVNRSGSYVITLKGNTDGGFTNRFVVFIDWDKNGSFNNTDETIEITQTLVGSTGVDEKEVVQTIVVPATAVLGTTRMRVKKTFLGPFLDPCTTGTTFGQAEDYSLDIGGLAVNDNIKNTVKVYPNPVVDYLTVKSPEKVKSVTVYDVSGKSVSTQNVNAEKSRIDLTRLSAGIYLVRIETNSEIQTVKVIKK